MHATRRRLLLTLGTAVLAGCGFERRRAPELSFATLALAGFQPDSPLAAELRSLLRGSATTRLVDAPTQAQAVLEALLDRRERSVVASTAFGQVRELQLRTRLRFRVVTPTGRELIEPTELHLARDISYSETFALAKEQEMAQLYRAMDADIAQQVLRRLASLQA